MIRACTIWPSHLSCQGDLLPAGANSTLTASSLGFVDQARQNPPAGLDPSAKVRQDTGYEQFLLFQSLFRLSVSRSTGDVIVRDAHLDTSRALALSRSRRPICWISKSFHDTTRRQSFPKFLTISIVAIHQHTPQTLGEFLQWRMDEVGGRNPE